MEWRRVDCDGKESLVGARLMRATVHTIPLVVGGNNLPFDGDRDAIGGRLFVIQRGAGLRGYLAWHGFLAPHN